MKIYIEDLTFKCIIGILPYERKNKQQVIINLSFDYEFKNKKFIDYSKVSSKIEKIMKKEKFELLEDAILYIKNYLYKKLPISNLKIKITKPNIITNCIVSLEN